MIEAAHAAVDPEVWAQSGGIAGLVIFALFVSLWYFQKTQEKLQESHLKAQEKMYELHRNDLKEILDLHAREREKWGVITDNRQRETNEAIGKMTEAIYEIKKETLHVWNENGDSKYRLR